MWHGMTPRQIEHTGLSQFDAMYEEHGDQWDVWLEKAERLFDRQHDLGIRTLSIQDDGYPELLRAIGNDAPPLIHLLGNTALLSRPKAVAIIGARAADRDGINAAYELGARFAREGNVIISGLALGCDKAAHEGCLSVEGETIAIVASGLDITHPSENKPLQDAILAKGGLLLSEQLVGTKASGKNLVARNRLQAALSQSVILAQCPEHSGSMHTMRFARQYHKESLAVAYPRYAEINGGNRLLIESGQAKPLAL